MNVDGSANDQIKLGMEFLCMASRHVTVIVVFFFGNFVGTFCYNLCTVQLKLFSYL